MIGDRFLTKKEFDLWVKNLNRRLSGLSITGSGAEVPTSTPTHNDLESIQGGAPDDYYHLTLARHTDLIDGGDCGIHKHDDRYYTEAEIDALFVCVNNEVVCLNNEVVVILPV